MGDGKRILVIDDDAVFRDMLCEQLTDMEGYTCVGAQTGEEGLSQATSSYFDLVILDVVMPGSDGHAVCSALREAGVMAPIIMLTGDDSDAGAIRGLDAGATDYVSKPFKLGVLLARIRAQIRQFEHSDDAHLVIGHFDFSPGMKMLAPNGGGASKSDQIRLTDKEAQILKFLYLHGDRVVPRDELLGEVWGYNAGVTTHTLETHVYRLRQKMERDPSHAELLVTEPGGYRLVP